MFTRNCNIVFACCIMLMVKSTVAQIDYLDSYPFGQDTRFAKMADNVAIGRWWEPQPNKNHPKMREWIRSRPRDQVLAFAIYTHDHGVLKLTAQSFPLMPD